jgi:hypothetical protein
MLYFQHMKPVLISLLLAILLPSCTPSFGEASAPLSSNSYSAESKAAPARKIRKDGRMTMKARALEESAQQCVALVSTHHGTLSNATLTEDDYDATIRVPAKSLEPLMDALSGLGKVTYRKVSMDDVTDQYYDLEAELKNKRALRDRLRELVAKANTIKDTLKVEEELSRVQTELDQLEGRMKLLRSQVAMSTLNLNLARQKTPGPLGAAAKGTAWAVKKLFVWK